MENYFQEYDIFVINGLCSVHFRAVTHPKWLGS